MVRIPVIRNVSQRRGRGATEVIGYALVDNDLAVVLEKFTWTLNTDGYPQTTWKDKDGRWIRGKLHRMAYRLRHGELPVYPMQIDHINRDKMDARIVNLRVVTPSINKTNEGKRKNNRSGYRGVHWNSSKPGWKAMVRIKGKTIQRYFPGTEEGKRQAALAVNEAYRLLCPENPIPNPEVETLPA